VYATSEGEGSGRKIWRLTELHAAYRWLRGGVDIGVRPARAPFFRHDEARRMLRA
jgi:hypothetical protein